MSRGNRMGPSMRRRYLPRPRLTEKDWAFLSSVMEKNGKSVVEVFNGHFVKVWEPGAPVEVEEDGDDEDGS